MKLTIIYNNFAKNSLTAGWGFSCLITDGEQKVLFDTGNKGEALLGNLDKLKINTQDINKIVISHEHWDHLGGLFDLLEKKQTQVYGLSSFSTNLKNKIGRKTELIEITKQEEITKNILTTGLIKNNPDEQSLILKTPKGIVVVVGCSHPGVGKILDIAKKYRNIHCIIGGLHGFNDYEILKDIDVIGACHCTQQIKEIKERFPNQYKKIKAGNSFEWS